MRFATTPVPVSLDEGPRVPFAGQVRLLRLLTILLFLALGTRVWVLTVVRGPRYERQAARNRVRLEPTAPPRGAIVDRAGRLLATNRLAYRISLINLERARGGTRGQAPWLLAPGPAEAASAVGLPQPTTSEQLAQLAELLNLPTEQVAAAQAEIDDPNRPRLQPVVVVEDADAQTLTTVRERLWALPSVLVQAVPVRRYPFGPLGAHALGYVGTISASQLAAERVLDDERIARLAAELANARRRTPNSELDRVDELAHQLRIAERMRDQAQRVVGKTGLELTYDQDLRGEPGLQTWQVNARGQPLKLLSTTQGAPGAQLVLNLDVKLQEAAVRALAGRRGAVVALDPRDGSVLALVSSPSYDPNLFIPRLKQADWDKLNVDARPLLDRALAGAQPPGSTYKAMVTTAAGFGAGVINNQTTCTCRGGMRIGGAFKRCWATHGFVTLDTAVAHSCDVFYYIAALRMGPQPMIDMAGEFGLGALTGIDLPGERPGQLPDLERHRRRWRREWYPGDSANIAIGQGDVTATTLQMAQVTAAVANGGRLWRPRVVRQVRSSDGSALLRAIEPELLGRVDVLPAALAAIERGMVAAVERGTGRGAALPGIVVAAKTGSSETGGGRRAHAWFSSYAPVGRAEIAICALVEHGGHGSEAAGPVARAIMEAYFAQERAQP